MIAFGPVPSRRLGRSLGVNVLPPKACSYACVYCQVGPTPCPEIEPRTFYPPEEVARDVGERLAQLEARGEAVDVLTVVPDGEPTLDENLGETLDALGRFGRPRAVISNASLLHRPEVRERLARANWVSLKVDAARPRAWGRVNRPHPALDLEAVQAGMRAFAAGFRGTLVTETMLVEGVNDAPEEVVETARLVASLSPHVAYLAVPTRPPAVARTRPAPEGAVLAAYECFRVHCDRVELLGRDEEGDVASSGDPVADLLRTAAVHPLREDQAERLVAQGGGEAKILARLVATGRLRRVVYDGRAFYVRPHAPTRPTVI